MLISGCLDVMLSGLRKFVLCFLLEASVQLLMLLKQRLAWPLSIPPGAADPAPGGDFFGERSRELRLAQRGLTKPLTLR